MGAPSDASCRIWSAWSGAVRDLRGRRSVAAVRPRRWLVVVEGFGRACAPECRAWSAVDRERDGGDFVGAVSADVGVSWKYWRSRPFVPLLPRCQGLCGSGNAIWFSSGIADDASG